MAAKTVPAAALETVARWSDGRDDALEEGKGEGARGTGYATLWSGARRSVSPRPRNLVRGMLKKIYADYAKERGIGEITPG